MDMKQLKQTTSPPTLRTCRTVEEINIVVQAILESERRSHLDAVDRIERALGMSPRTCELRSIGKRLNKQTIDR